MKLERLDRPSAEEVEVAVEQFFAGAWCRLQNRPLHYTLRRQTSLRGAEIARR